MVRAYTRAVSMCLYPAFRASATAFSCASASCQVPKPRAGMVAPVFSLKVVILAIVLCILLELLVNTQVVWWAVYSLCFARLTST